MNERIITYIMNECIITYIIAATYFLSRWSSLLAHPRRRIDLVNSYRIDFFFHINEVVGLK